MWQKWLIEYIQSHSRITCSQKISLPTGRTFLGSKVFNLPNHNRDVHVFLVGLLADQLFGQFLILFGRPKKIVWSQRPDNLFFVYSLDFFIVQSRYQRVTNFQKRLDKKFKRVDKKNVRSLRLDKFFCDFQMLWPKCVSSTRLPHIQKKCPLHKCRRNVIFPHESEYHISPVKSMYAFSF